VVEYVAAEDGVDLLSGVQNQMLAHPGKKGCENEEETEADTKRDEG
jgi:hypothetical protein